MLQTDQTRTTMKRRSWRLQEGFQSPARLFLVLILTGMAALLFAQRPQLLVSLVSEGGYAQVFYSADQAWSEAGSVREVVLPGERTVRFGLPLRLPAKLRLDPSEKAGTLQLNRVRFKYLFFRADVPLSSIEAVNNVAVAVDQESLQVSASGSDPQLRVSVPYWLIFSGFAFGLLTTLLLAWGMMCLWPRQNGLWLGLAWCSVVVAFGLAVWFPFINAPITPFLDDWRYFMPGAYSLVDGGWQWLAIASNDTYFLTGQLIDWVVITVTGGSLEALRLIGLTLLALFLAFAITLAIRVCGYFAPVAVAGLAIAVGGNSYWGAQLIAYHQFLPVLFLFVVLHYGEGRVGVWKGLALGLLVVAAGLSYISGPILFLAAALAYLLVYPDVLRWPQRRALFWLILLFALATMVVQLVLVVGAQGSLLDRNHATATVYPSSINYWLYLAGLFGAGLGVRGTALSLDLLALLLSAVLGLTFLLFRHRHVDNEKTLSWERFVGLALFGGSFAYAAIVTSGRAGFVPDYAGASDVAGFAKIRFHYWWLAAMLPISWAVALNIIATRWGFFKKGVPALVLVLLMVKVVHVNVWDPRANQRKVEWERAGIQCLREELAAAAGRVPIDCPSVYPGDIAPAIWAIHDHDFPFGRELLQITED